MFTIRFQTLVIRPDLQVSIRTSAQNWGKDIGGNYQNDEWVFELDEDGYGGGMVFKFVLEEQVWMNGPNLVIQPVAGGNYIFGNAQVTFPNLVEALVESGYVAQRFFPPNFDPNHEYDVIVIGSGAGGGVVADQAADYGLDVLVLELGSYLFPTHVGNLPRQQALARRVDKNIWDLWDDFRVIDYVNAPNSKYDGAQGFNLGGRSIFWGGFIPRLSWWELEIWPEAVRWALEDPGYERAEQLVKKSQPDSDYQTLVKSSLANAFPNYTVFNAPMAVQQVDARQRTISAGVFSTADLLMESRLTGGVTGNEKLTINLNHAVTKIDLAGNRATGVTAYDLISGVERKYQAKRVVLAAGSVESPKLAQLSGLQDASGKIGKGLTDHPIFFTHFAIPANSPFYRPDMAAKILLKHKNANAEAHRYNILIELGTDFNQGRYVDPDILAAQQAVKANSMLCEIVFLFNAPLLDQNTVTQNGPAYAKPAVFMAECPITVAEWNEINDLHYEIIQKLGGEVLENGNLNLNRAGLGGVAHEVGSLRIGPAGQGVVDNDLRFHGYENLYACDLSVFPASPAANPTLTLVALALRLADYLRT